MCKDIAELALEIETHNVTDYSCDKGKEYCRDLPFILERLRDIMVDAGYVTAAITLRQWARAYEDVVSRTVWYDCADRPQRIDNENSYAAVVTEICDDTICLEYSSVSVYASHKPQFGVGTPKTGRFDLHCADCGKKIVIHELHPDYDDGDEDIPF